MEFSLIASNYKRFRLNYMDFHIFLVTSSRFFAIPNDVVCFSYNQCLILWISVQVPWMSLDYLDSCSLSIDSHGLQTNCYELVVFLWVESFNVFRLLRMFIHFDLENTILLRVNACFVLVFAGITRIPAEIHSVFKQKMISK